MADEAYDHNDNIVTHNNSLYPDHEYHTVQRNWIFDSTSILCPIAIFVGVFTNILAFVVLVRSRLWLKHEGYVYLAANFCVNVGILLFGTSTFWSTSVYGTGDYYPLNSSNCMCKVWLFLMIMFSAYGWLSVALLINVYLREHLVQRSWSGCLMFAAKYCTLFASKIIVGVIFTVLIVLSVPYLVIYTIESDGECYPSSVYIHYRLVIIVEMLVMGVLQSFFLLCNLLITLCTRRVMNIVGSSQIEHRSVSNQMKVVVLTLSSITLLSHVVLMSCLINVVEGVVVGLAYSLSIGLQPILCFVILKALRDGFRSQLRNIICCRRPVPSLDREKEVVELSAIQEDPPSATNPKLSVWFFNHAPNLNLSGK